MATKMTAYLTTYTISELDMRNIKLLEDKTGYEAAVVIHHAIGFCKTSLDFMKKGNVTTVLHKHFGYNATTASLNLQTVAERFNNRNPQAKKLELTMYRSSNMMQDLHDIKQVIKVDDDNVAFAFALEYAVQMVEKLRGANNGRKAQIFFCPNNKPGERGWLLTKHPYNISLRNSFKKAGRHFRAGIKTTFKHQLPSIDVKPHVAVETPAQPAPTQPSNADVQDAAPSDIKTMKPLALKTRTGDPDGGFRV